MVTRKEESPTHNAIKEILELIEQNGHACVDDLITDKAILKSIKDHICKQYRQPDENYNLEFLNKVMMKLRDEEIMLTNNDSNETQDVKGIKNEIADLQRKIQETQSNIYDLYFRNSSDLENNINRSLIVNNDTTPHIQELEVILKKLLKQKRELEKEFVQIKLRMEHHKNINENHIKEIEKLQQDIEDYLNLVYIESPDKKLYFLNEKYKIIFVDSPDILQKELKKIRDYKNSVNYANSKFESIKEMNKYKRYIFKLRHQSRERILSENELHKCFPIINKFLMWENALYTGISTDKCVSFFRGHSNSNYLLKPSINRSINYKKMSI